MKLPEYAKLSDSGMDVQANIEHKIPIIHGSTLLIPTGIFVELPETPNEDFNWEIQVRPRSGLAYKEGLTVLNSPGTIDQGYRNEIGVLLHSTRKEAYVIHPADRIAQIVLSKSYKINWVTSDTLNDSDRGQGGFGSTGVSSV